MIFGARNRKYFSSRFGVLECRFHLPGKYCKFAVDATKKWHGFSESKSGNPRHMMVSLLNHAVGFGVAVDKNDDLVEIWQKDDFFESHYSQRIEDFFQAIAKYVRAGSYITFVVSSDMRTHRWFFNGDCMVGQRAKLTFEDIK